MSQPPILETLGLHRRFRVSQGMFKPKATLNAVNGVDLRVMRGETLGIVGESGCGKSTLAQMLLNLLPPSEGHVLFDGHPAADAGRAAFARRVQPIFQDPFSSLNPRKTILDIVSMPLRVHRIGTAAEQERTARRLMERVGLPARFASRYPKELSGGQRQRVAIARALVMQPEVVICDEPTSALDASVQSQILNLLMELKADFNLTYVFISHNLSVVEHIADRVAVMYLGRVVELTGVDGIFDAPQHPYTKALLESVLTVAPDDGVPDLALGAGFPDPLHPAPGCPFHPRCPRAYGPCDSVVPRPVSPVTGGAACHLTDPEYAPDKERAFA
ncbi:ATP-binding cassette domain-containing protein [Roseicyclus sp. F158]|uniref:ATP-binding cassette domain-containing protein n=1 Tax=Tropicimonas omnivorans TaxID=3075590 RepID=A0ABU3DG07_9RHOB|nr:oligopeptide/dipeptide ABC transporter ATP-binding protein [Roseicyclus sp. F158]MDT0682077.1 ATP-binding cassette domain-containing protein [Roseicyclus sp. F158]